MRISRWQSPVTREQFNLGLVVVYLLKSHIIGISHLPRHTLITIHRVEIQTTATVRNPADHKNLPNTCCQAFFPPVSMTSPWHGIMASKSHSLTTFASRDMAL